MYNYDFEYKIHRLDRKMLYTPFSQLVFDFLYILTLNLLIKKLKYIY